MQNICRIIQKLKSLVCNISHKIYANLCYKILLVTYDNVGVSTLDFLLSSTNKTYLFDITEILLKIVWNTHNSNPKQNVKKNGNRSKMLSVIKNKNVDIKFLELEVIRYAQSRKIGKPKNLKILGNNKTKGPI